MKTWSFYNSKTGVFDSRKFEAGTDKNLQLNTKHGYVAIEGDFDPLFQMFDIQSGKVIEYLPQPPDNDHEWSIETKRWILKQGIATRNAKRNAALREIERIERDEQPRALREAALGKGDKRLREIESRIETLRSQLND